MELYRTVEMYRIGGDEGLVSLVSVSRELVEMYQAGGDVREGGEVLVC